MIMRIYNSQRCGFSTHRSILLYACAVLSIACCLILSGCLDRTTMPQTSPSAEWKCVFDVRPNDTMILLLPGTVSTHRLVGTVKPFLGDGWLPESPALIEVWSHDNDRTRRRSLIALDGRIVPMNLPPGRYCFRASAVGFNSAIGRIRIVSSSRDAALDVRLHLAN